MALGKEIGDYSFSITSVSYEDEAGVRINVDGTATSFGTVLGSIALSGEPGAQSGSASWRGQGFLDDGEVVTGQGAGTWEALGQHRWRTRLIIQVSDGQTFASDGLLDLASRSFKGKNLEWS